MDDVRSHLASRTPEQPAQAEVMHELRSPLTVIVGRVQLLRRHLRGGEDPERVHEDLDAIEAALARLTAAVARLDRSD
jgi:signal transduction histidine kinase